jgi:hypothetical protein
MKRKIEVKNKKIFFIICVLFLTMAASLSLSGVVSADSLTNRVKGRILLQVQQKGEAWYVNSSGQRTYMGGASDAYSLMRNIGVGITNKDLAKIQVGDKNLTSASSTDSDSDGLSDAIETALSTNIDSTDSDGDGTDDKTEILNGYDPNSNSTTSLVDEKFAKKQAGKILLQVEKNGEAWYVYPGDNKRYFLGKASDAYNIMRELGLGITDSDLNKISEKATSTSADLKSGDKKSGKEGFGRASSTASSTKGMFLLGGKIGTSTKGMIGTSTVPEGAVTACSSLSAGDSCSFSLGDKTATGTCAEINSQLACMNKNMKNGGPRGEMATSTMASGSEMMFPGGNGATGAPQEMITACESSSAGDSCTFTGPDKKSVTGICTKTNNQLMCRMDDN